MPARVDLFYHCHGFLLQPTANSDLFMIWMKAFQQQVRQAMFSSAPTLLADVQQKGQHQRVFQPYALEPFHEVEPGVLKASVKLLIQEADLQAFAQHWQKTRRELRFSDQNLKLLTVSAIEQISATELGRNPIKARCLALNFISPTFWGSGLTHIGKQKRRASSYPIPDPGRLFYGLWESWNHFYPDLAFPQEVAEEADRELEILEMVQASIQPYAVAPKIIKQGFRGSLLLKLPSERRLRQDLLTLARYAEWAGTGRQCSLGFGWTQIDILL